MSGENDNRLMGDVIREDRLGEVSPGSTVFMKMRPGEAQ
jgi:hypothetical protein